LADGKVKRLQAYTGSEVRHGVIIVHGCGQNIFLTQENVDNIGAMVCPKCRELIFVHYFDKSQLQKGMRDWPVEKIREFTKDSDDVVQ